jgi:hypothetical protein
MVGTNVFTFPLTYIVNALRFQPARDDFDSIHNMFKLIPILN